LEQRTPSDCATLPDIAEAVAGDAAAAALLERLSSSDREIATLLLDGFAVGEIATILGCSRSAVTMRLRRVKKHLRSLLEHERKEETVAIDNPKQQSRR
jgi:RNA polymerase sigma-70 factor (ECF subfamily)